MIKKCIVCGNDYYVAEKKGAHKRSKYCSRKCQNTLYRKQRREWGITERKRDPDKSKQRQKRYRDSHKEELRIREVVYRLKPNAIYSHIKANNRHLLLISKESFVDWYISEPKVCYYCGIPESYMTKYPRFFVGSVVRRLSIDRLDNEKPYQTGNIVLACRRCNGVKSDFFSPQEMRMIAQEYITPKWKEV